MRHRYPVAFALIVLLLVPGVGTALAQPPAHHQTPRMADISAMQQRAALHLATAAPRFVSPLERLTRGAAVLKGHVYDYSGAPLGADLDAWVQVAGVWEHATGATDGVGAYTLSGLGAASANGELYVSPTIGDSWFSRSGLTWGDPGPTTFDFRPGEAAVSLNRGGSWHSDAYPDSNWTQAYVDLHGTGLYGSTVVSGGGSVSPVTGQAQSLPGHQSMATVNFWMDEGVEVPVSIDTVAGSTAGSVSADQATALRTTVYTPVNASGKPGTYVSVGMNAFPVNWVSDFTGYSEYPATAPVKAFGQFYTSSANDQAKRLRIPTTARPGYWYLIGLQHTTGPLYLETPFQVCTLKSSRASVAAGRSVRLSGIVPTKGHWGSRAGIRKTLVLYARTTKGTQPMPWKTSPKGWKKIASFKCNGYGKYTSPLLHPKRSTWYVVRYAGDDWYWAAYTSVIRVGVK